MAYPSLAIEAGEISIGAHCDAGEIMIKKGSNAQIGICCSLGWDIKESHNGKTYLGGIPISWTSGGGSLMVETSIYAGEIKAAFRGQYCSFSKEYDRSVTIWK